MTVTPRMLGLALLAAFGLARACVAPPVEAQDVETLASARVCFSESARADECTQIVHATAERALRRHRSYLSELRSYSPRATGRESYGARSWIAALHPDRVVPASFAESMNRELVRVRFAALVVVAWRALHALDTPPCPGAIEWAARWCRSCRRRMRVAGYTRAACNLSNAWWRP